MTRAAALVVVLIVVGLACAVEAPPEVASDTPPDDGATAPSIPGQVVDQDGKGVMNAEACWIVGTELGGCATADVEGRFELAAPAREQLRIVAHGYHAVQLGVAALEQPIVLARAPVLFVRLVDAITGEPIESGSVRVTYTSGRDFGPFPVNRAGLRIRRVLPVGDALVRPTAEGYGITDPVSIRLQAGMETSVEIPMPPAD